MRSLFSYLTPPQSLIALMVLALLLLASCSFVAGQESATEAAPVQPSTAAVFPTATITPVPTVIPTNTPDPTPITPAITVSDQKVGEDGLLVIDEASLPEAGWLAIYSLDGDQPADLLAYLGLPKGIHQRIKLAIDPREATDRLLAQLHWNAGDPQEFELPEPDLPMADSGRAAFAVEVTRPQASVVIEDQAVGTDGIVTVTALTALDPTWVVIHADDDGTVGSVLGQVLFEPGEYENVSVPIRWQLATPKLHAVLHQDNGELRYLDFPNGDQPLLANGMPIAATFMATYPPDILVYDQPVLDGKVVIDRVISNGPGWVAVHFDDNGQPGLIIGKAALRDGLNEQVEVDLIKAALTPVLYVRLYQDTVSGDTFNFPGADPPIMFDGRLPQAERFITDGGSYIIVHDQRASSESDVLVSIVMATNSAWLAIHADEDGTLGPIMGQTLVPAGISRDVVVAIDKPLEPGTYHAVLYQDAGESGVFEFPGGADSPFRVQGGFVDVPFQIGPALGGS